MNLSNISAGMTVKNYKELCTLLEESTKQANSKKAQIKEWERYFRFTTRGQKITIEEIYTVPLPKEDKRQLRIINGYKLRMKKIIMHLLLKEGMSGQLVISKNSLLRKMNMININYSFCRRHTEKLSTYLDINIKHVQEFFDLTGSRLKDNLESVLDILQNELMIYYEKERHVCAVNVHTSKNILNQIRANRHKFIDDYDNEHYEFYTHTDINEIHRPATDEEKEFILLIEGQICDELECKNKQEIIIKNKWKEFIEKVNEELFNQCNILYYYDCYKIFCNDKRISRELGNLEEFIMNQEQEMIELISLNTEFRIQLLENAGNRHNKALQDIFTNISNNEYTPKKTIMRGEEKYVDEEITLINSMIDWSYKNITEDIYKSKKVT